MITTDKETGCKKLTGETIRLVYNDKQIIILIDGAGETKTWTKQKVEEFTNEQEALNQIDVLELPYNSTEK